MKPHLLKRKGRYPETTVSTYTAVLPWNGVETMISRIHILLFILIFLCPVLGSPINAYANKGKGVPSVEQKGKEKKKRKSLLRALLLMDLVSLKKRSSKMSLSDRAQNSRAPLSFLRNTAMKESAVEELYRKHGYNSIVQWKINNFSTHKSSFEKRLVRSGRYLREMSDIFAEHGLPRDLAHLPLIESQFNPFAYSRSRASGPWQLMPATARRLKLKIDWWVDERRDPLKSTRAAAVYLKYLHKRFQSWNLALAAYNAGEGRISSVMRRTGKSDFWTIRNTRLLARETRNYVPSYIAATAIAMYPESFGFDGINYERPVQYDEVTIFHAMDLEVVASFTGAAAEEIRDLNPELRRMCTPPNVPAYTLRIPPGTERRFLRNVARTEGQEASYVNFYTVKSGDTVQKIADTLGSTIQTIRKMNELGRRALIHAGKQLLIPLESNWFQVR